MPTAVPEQARTPRSTSAAVPGLRVLAVSEDACEVALRPEAVRDGLADLRWRLPELLSGPRRSLVVEVSALTSLSSTAIAVLLLAERRCRARGGRLVVRGAGRRARRLLEVTGLEQEHTTEGDHP